MDKNPSNIPPNSIFSLLSYASKGLVSKLVVDIKMAKYFTKQHAIKYGLKAIVLDMLTVMDYFALPNFHGFQLKNVTG